MGEKPLRAVAVFPGAKRVPKPRIDIKTREEIFHLEEGIRIITFLDLRSGVGRSY
tara:strand:- start:286 stop:450 length:165 start_codon:yes stop_codon:yes gene_type:complete